MNNTDMISQLFEGGKLETFLTLRTQNPKFRSAI